MPEKRAPIDISGKSLADIAALLEDRSLPPVERWNPGHCGDSGIRIDRDGRWWHEEREIERGAMVRLFSTVLRREPDGSHVLVTPAEKLSVAVELAPLLATAMTSEGEGAARRLAFQLNRGDAVIAGPDHPLRMAGEVPLVDCGRGLEAAVARPVYYELAEIALGEGADPPGVWSDGAFFPLVAAGSTGE
ncbi:DUF1285 domain-containing protein [Sphingomonas ginkgonis]|uniref:DUF1285 domain-containing protein n=1 Tax=Sphingomonas ginkgonis TaxID=2315330 RepID=A0A429VCR7_9SPHN|nr:DUF1285 domain-containing protein [Sphingomonas ginkgonis]RST31677.1 DUF1285 domain-containing protein [Sphingomonas ginkgonis]